MANFKPWVLAMFKLLGSEDPKSINGGLDLLAVLISFVGSSFGCAVSIVFVGADCWRAFKQRKHWIPGDSLIFGALAMQLLMLLNKPSSNFSFNDSNLVQDACVYLNFIHSEWILILIGRVSTCMLMGCLLPGVATPLSTNLRTDMAALFISFALLAVYIVSHELFILPTAYKMARYVEYYDYSSETPEYKINRCPNDPWNSISLELTNVIILISMVTLALLLGCAALASIGIHEIVSRKIPLLLSPLTPYLYPPKILWEKVEEQVLKSWIVVRTANPQYIISRSILSASVALIITVCNALLVFELASCSYKVRAYDNYEDCYYVTNSTADFFKNICWRELNYEGCIRPSISIPLILHYVVIILGSAVIYCRCVTAAVYYPRGMRWKLFRDREYWKIEAFWLSHLLDLKDGSKRHRRGIGGESYLTELIVRLLRSMRLHKLLPVILWLQTFLVFFSKGCWLLSQLIFSNNLFHKLVVGSAERAPGETQLQRDPAYVKYKKACLTMQGENSAGLWIANKTSIQELKKRLGKGEEEGKRCIELIALLTDKACTGFSGQRCLKPGLPLGLNVESELNVRQRSCKMTAVSILTLIIELCPFIQNEGERENMAERAIKACSQAWNIMDVVEYSDSEAAVLIKAADELFHKLEKERKWLDHRLPMSDSAEKSPEAARAAVENLYERGEEVANAYSSKAWEEVAAGYSLCRQCRSTINDYEFNSVEEVVDGLEGMLADVMGSCIAKAAQVIAKDCKKWATNLEEERIWKAAKLVGKVKGITEKTGVMLEATPRSDIDESGASSGKHSFKWYEKFPTMTR